MFFPKFYLAIALYYVHSYKSANKMIVQFMLLNQPSMLYALKQGQTSPITVIQIFFIAVQEFSFCSFK